MVGGTGGNQFRQYAGQNVGNQNGYNAVQNVGNQVVQNVVQNLGVQNVGNQNGLMVVPGIANQNQNGNVRTKRRDDAYLQTQLLVAQKEEAGIQLQAEEFDLMVATTDLDKIKEFNANCILMANLQQASNRFWGFWYGTRGGTVEKHPAIVEETRAYFESLYNNLEIKVEKVNTVNRKLRETNADLTTELARYKNQEKFFEINQEKYDKLERKNSTVSFLQEEKKRLKSDFKIREDEFLDKQILLKNNKKELDNILVKMGQSIQTMHMISRKPDSFYHTEQKMALGYQNLFYLKQAQQKQKSLYNGNVLLEKYDPPAMYDSKETLKLAQESRLKMKQLNKEIKPSHKTLELEIERRLRAVVSHEIMSIVQSNFVVDTSNLQTELEQCKYDKISYDKAHNDMQQKIKRFQAQFGDLKGKCKDTPGVSDTLDPLSQKLENENVELEFQVMNYVREIEHLKTTYKNLFDSISVTRTQTKSIIDSLQNKLHDTVYENAKLRAQLFDKASEQKDTTKGASANTKFTNQSILGKPFLQPIRNNFVVRQPNAFQSERPKFSNNRVPQKVDETNDLSKPVTSNSVPITNESKVVKNDNVIAPGMFRIDPRKTFMEDKFVPINKVSASIRTKPITVSQTHVITKKDVNSDSNGLSSTGVDNTAKTRRPFPRSHTKNDKVPFESKSRCIKNEDVKVEEHHMNLMHYKNKKHMSSECNNVKLAIRNDKFEIICAMCKQCLITVNHDACVLNNVNDMNSRKMNQKASVSNTENQKKQKPQKFLGTVRFGNDHVAAILGYGDLQWGNILITRAYLVEGLGHNLFLFGKFYDLDLEVTFRRNTYFVRNLEGIDLLKGNRTTNLYTLNLHKMASASLIYLMARATSTKSCKEKSKRASHPPKPIPNSKQRLHLLYMDLCGLMRIASINGKRYVLVIVDDDSLYTWVNFLRSKDEAPEVIKIFLKRIIILLQSPVIIIRTDKGTEFKNQILKGYFDSVGISHQVSSVITPQQNEAVERRN
ncbi:retrovirus-related pol polyprotein from transposon TNT 1-94 [Tanacetum coccineum]